MEFVEIKRRLTALDTACICDANKGLRVIDPAIRPIRNGLKFIGRAHTVTCHEDFLTVIKGLRDAVKDEVLVIDSQGSQTALAGELFPTEAIRKQLAGVVIDGPCRDSAKIRTLPIPYYARSFCPLSGTTSRLFETQIPITCGGVAVHPGDILFGDDDGIVVANAAEISEAIPVAEDIQRKEELLLTKMGEGVSLLQMLNFDEHSEKVRAGEESRLEFLV